MASGPGWEVGPGLAHSLRSLLCPDRQEGNAGQHAYFAERRAAAERAEPNPEAVHPEGDTERISPW